MKKIVEVEGFYSDLQKEYDVLFVKVIFLKECDFEKFKIEIEDLLVNEIVLCYYYQNGCVEQVFQEDKDVVKVFEIL